MPAVLSSSTSNTTTVTLRRTHRCHLLLFLVALLGNPSVAPVRSLHHTTLVLPPPFGRLPSPSRQRQRQRQHQHQHQHRLVKIHPSTSSQRPILRLLPSSKLYLFFDKFIHPYGVNNDTLFDNTNDNDNDGAVVVELLDALLPRMRTKEDKSRILEGFQRARLDEQLRLSKLSKRGARRGDDHDDDVGIGHDGNQREEEEEDMIRMASSFQQARLAEQLRLSVNRRMNWESQSRSDGTKGFVFDKNEAIHRALLEERLRIRRFQQRQQSKNNDIVACSPNPIEMAMAEYETENEKERKTLQLTMVQQNENDVDDSDNGDGKSGLKKEGYDSIIIGTKSTNEQRGNGKPATVSQLSVNHTDDESFKQLNDKLKLLHKMVGIASSSSSTSSRDITRQNATSTMKNLLFATYLPLQPREDASYISIVLAPLAYLISAIYLMGSAVFYAVFAILDVICNDDQDEYSTRACLRETSHVIRSCWDYLFLKEVRTGLHWRAAAKRTMRAVQSSTLASFYAVKFVLVRAIGHSKYTTSCMDAGTGSLRYLVYMVRSLQVIWDRVVDAIQKMCRSQRRMERSHPLRFLSNVQLPILRPSQNGRSLKDDQQRQQSNEIYNNKLRLLNLERLNLERDKHQLLEAQRQLEYEKRKVLAEGVNILSWYIAAKNAAAAAATTADNETTQKLRVRTRHWKTWWFGRNNVN